MIAYNHTDALKQFLHDEYEEKIRLLLDECEKEKQEHLSQVKTLATDEAKVLLQKAKDDANEREGEALAKAESALQEKFNTSVEHFVRLVLEGLSQRCSSLTAKKKESIVLFLLANLKESVKSQGYKATDFTYHVPKNMRASGATSSLDELKVVAESKSIVFEDSVDAYFARQKDRIISDVMSFLEQ